MPRAEEAKLLCLRRVPCRITLCVNGQDSKAEIFDVFLCHNSEDTPAVREIAQMLVKEGIKPWLDEDEIRPEGAPRLSTSMRARQSFVAPSPNVVANVMIPNKISTGSRTVDRRS
jgi:TIR domain